jgi:uncharacterized membrane protein
MAKVIIVLLTALVFEAVGVVFLSAGLKELREVSSAGAIGRVLFQGATNPRILLGVLFEAVFFVFLLVLLKRHDASLIWPLTSLGFVLTTLFARIILHEQVTVMRWVGVLLIMAGATLVSWSEREKPPKPGAGVGFLNRADGH